MSLRTKSEAKTAKQRRAASMQLIIPPHQLLLLQLGTPNKSKRGKGKKSFQKLPCSWLRSRRKATPQLWSSLQRDPHGQITKTKKKRKRKKKNNNPQTVLVGESCAGLPTSLICSSSWCIFDPAELPLPWNSLPLSAFIWVLILSSFEEEPEALGWAWTFFLFLSFFFKLLSFFLFCGDKLALVCQFCQSQYTAAHSTNTKQL